MLSKEVWERIYAECRAEMRRVKGAGPEGIRTNEEVIDALCLGVVATASAIGVRPGTVVDSALTTGLVEGAALLAKVGAEFRAFALAERARLETAAAGETKTEPAPVAVTVFNKKASA